MKNRRTIAMFAVLCLIALGLGYWVGQPPPSTPHPPPPPPLEQGLVAYYPFNSNAKDESGNGNDGEVKGPVSAEDRFGLQSSSYEFSRVTDVIDIPNIPSNTLTVSLWYKYNGFQKKHHTLLCHDEIPNGIHHLIVDEYNKNIGCYNSKFIGSGYKFTAGQTYFIVLMKDVKNCTIFINGLPVSSHGDCFENKAWPLSRIGNCGTQGGQGALGIIDDVRIYNRTLTEAEVKALYELEKPKLKRPYFTSNPDDANNVKIEAAIRTAANRPTGELTETDLEKVTSLNFRKNQLVDISALAGLTRLNFLNLGLTPTTDISALAGLTKLDYLDLGGTKINDEQLKYLAGLTNLTGLSLCSISYPNYENKLTDVSALAGLTQLKNLSLYNNSLTDVSALAGLTKLTHLRLQDNQLTDLGALVELTKLKVLILENNPDLTKAQIAELQKALPKCKITHNATK